MRILFRVVLIGALSLPALGQMPALQDSPRILVLGDSLSAAYGIPVQQGWVALLQQRLAAQGYPHRVINASISGDTTQGGLARLPAALRTHQPSILLIELGANDGLRGLPLKTLRANLLKMIELGRAAGARPMLFEMYIPSNYGAEYQKQFVQSFATVARQQQVTLQPFFLRNFAMESKAFQDDGIHPGVAAQAQMLDTVWPQLQPLLGRKKASARQKKP